MNQGMMMFPQGRRSTCAVLALTNLRKTIETTIDCFDEFFLVKHWTFAMRKICEYSYRTGIYRARLHEQQAFLFSASEFSNKQTQEQFFYFNKRFRIGIGWKIRDEFSKVCCPQSFLVTASKCSLD